MIEIPFPMLEIIEPYLEVINLLLAIAIVGYGVKVYSLLEGQLRETWKFFMFAIALFGLHELVGSLSEFGVFNVDGLYALTELLFILGFAISIIAFINLFKKISLGKKVAVK